MVRFGAVIDFNEQPVTSPEFLAGFSQAAEDAGFDSIWMGDHVVMPVDHQSQYPYGERMPYEDAPNPDPIATLAFIAGQTNKDYSAPMALAWRPVD